MILINTTFHIHCSLRPDFVKWLRERYEPEATRSGVVSNPKAMRVLGGNDADGMSFASQLECASLSDAKKWHDGEGAVLREEMHRLWGDKALFFTTYLEVID